MATAKKKNTKNSSKQKFRYTPTVQFTLASALLVFAILISRGDTLHDWEVTVFQFIYSFSDKLLLPFLFITQFGSIYVLAVLLVIYLARRRYHIFLRMLMTGLLAYLMAGFVKYYWGRPRPDGLLEGVTNLDYVYGPGFPSGHVALATACALTLGHYLPKKYHWVVVVWILGVGASRLYLGVHAPLDILGGFAIGWAAYALFRHVRLYDVSFQRKPPRKRNLKLSNVTPRKAGV